MKHLTLDEFKKIHEDWKATSLSIRLPCSARKHGKHRIANLKI